MVIGVCSPEWTVPSEPPSTGWDRITAAGRQPTDIGLDVGAFVPIDDQFDNALIIHALFEYFVTPRVSLRTTFGLADPGFKREAVDSLRQVPLRLDVNYNWEGGKWDPFVGAGCRRILPAVQGQQSGVLPVGNQSWVQHGRRYEYFINGTVGLKGEARYD